jgi:hypothetical protein
MGGRGAGPVGGSEHILAYGNGRSVEGSNNRPAVQDVARSIVVICVEVGTGGILKVVAG